MTDPQPSAHAVAQHFGPRRRLLVMVVVALAFVMNLLDVTILHVAIPSIQRGLQASVAAVQWCVAGYTLVFATLLILGGRLGDALGYRRLFLFGVAGFTLSSLGCGAAGSASALVVARLAQGAFAALMMPQVMALMQVLYLPHERARAYAVFGMLGGLSAALGPIFGGLLIEADTLGLGWRLCFLINLPVGLVSLVAGWRCLPAGRSSEQVQLDGGGALGSVACMGLLLYGLIQGPEQGWRPDALGALVASAPIGMWLWRRLERRSAAGLPVLFEPSLFHLRGVRLGLACTLCVSGLTSAYLLLLSYVLQSGMGIDPLGMSLLCLPVALGSTFGITVLGQRSLQRWGARSIVAGVTISAVALGAVGGWVSLDVPPYWFLVVCQAAMGLGLGLTGPSLSAITLYDVPVAQAGAASGIVTTCQQLSGALTVAGAGWLFFRVAPTGMAGDAAMYARGFHQALWLFWALLAGSAWLAWRLPSPVRASAALAAR